MAQIELKELTQGRVRALSGQERGVAAREKFGVDGLDAADDVVVVIVPDDLDTISPSFLQGMFSVSIKKLGQDRFREHYVFDAPPTIIEQVSRAIMNTMIDRSDLLN